MNYSEYDVDAADDDLTRIVRLKEDLTNWLDSLSFIKAPGIVADVIEEQFDDLMTGEWHRLTDISGSIGWTAEIPSCEALRAKLFAEAKRAKEARHAKYGFGTDVGGQP